MSTKTTTSVREPIGRLGQRREVVIPREICDQLHLHEGDFVAFARRANGVFIKPKRLADPDDTLRAKESAQLKKAEQQMRQGKFVTLTELEHELDSKPRARSRKTA
jgi:bifunctional DNA-binding transcriptional regulator/antitoxin component of YhaV-PrlF toxin-antitoxin module